MFPYRGISGIQTFWPPAVCKCISLFIGEYPELRKEYPPPAVLKHLFRPDIFWPGSTPWGGDHMVLPQPCFEPQILWGRGGQDNKMCPAEAPPRSWELISAGQGDGQNLSGTRASALPLAAVIVRPRLPPVAPAIRWFEQRREAEARA